MLERRSLAARESGLLLAGGEGARLLFTRFFKGLEGIFFGVDWTELGRRILEELCGSGGVDGGVGGGGGLREKEREVVAVVVAGWLCFGVRKVGV